MPIIFSYPQISTVSNQDLFVISRVNTSTGVPETKSVEAEDLASYIGINLPDNVIIANSLAVGSTNFPNIRAGSATIGSQNEASGAYSFAAGELNNSSP